MLSKSSIILSTQKLFALTIGGAAVFWATTFVTSLLPIAAEYRAAFATDWKIQTVWVDSLFAGTIIACGVSYFLLRSLNRTPTANAIPETAKLSLAALAIVTILVDVPRSLLASGPGNAWYYFLVGLMFNAARFLLLGLAIGYLCWRLHRSA